MYRIVGFLYIALSAAGFGTLALFGRSAYADGMDALTILFFRFTLAAVVLFGWLGVRRAAWPRGRVLYQLMGMGALGYVGQAFAYLTALQYASAGLVALLLYLYPVFVTLLAVLILREPLTLTKGVALGLALSGTALTVGPGSGQALGIGLAISAAVIYSIYIMVGTHVLKQVSPVQSSAIIFAAAGLMSGVLMLINGVHLPQTGVGWGAVVAIVLFATLLPVMAFLAGLERIGPTHAAMLSTLEPVITVGLAAWGLGETPTPLTLVGGALILAAVMVLTRAEMRPTSPPSSK